MPATFGVLTIQLLLTTWAQWLGVSVPGETILRGQPAFPPQSAPALVTTTKAAATLRILAAHISTYDMGTMVSAGHGSPRQTKKKKTPDLTGRGNPNTLAHGPIIRVITMPPLVFIYYSFVLFLLIPIMFRSVSLASTSHPSTHPLLNLEGLFPTKARCCFFLKVGGIDSTAVDSRMIGDHLELGH